MPEINPAFESWYTGIFGKRWPSLRESLVNSAASIPYDGAGVRAALVKPYWLDRASILAAASLRLPEKAEEAAFPEKTPLVLDACAAPGGKTLVLASRIAAMEIAAMEISTGTEDRTSLSETALLANELSPARRRRLSQVLDEHLPPALRKQVTVSGFDAAKAAGRISERERFSAILLDAPCSSERHVLKDAAALAQWTPARPRFLAGRQWALLSAAFLLLRSGGSLVYATCALSPAENDGVAGRLMEKYAHWAVLDPPDFSEGEATAWGRLILPDLSGGMGPMYVARFRKS